MEEAGTCHCPWQDQQLDGKAGWIDEVVFFIGVEHELGPVLRRSPQGMGMDEL